MPHAGRADAHRSMCKKISFPHEVGLCASPIYKRSSENTHAPKPRTRPALSPTQRTDITEMLLLVFPRAVLVWVGRRVLQPPASYANATRVEQVSNCRQVTCQAGQRLVMLWGLVWRQWRRPLGDFPRGRIGNLARRDNAGTNLRRSRLWSGPETPPSDKGKCQFSHRPEVPQNGPSSPEHVRNPPQTCKIRPKLVEIPQHGPNSSCIGKVRAKFGRDRPNLTTNALRLANAPKPPHVGSKFDRSVRLSHRLPQTLMSATPRSAKAQGRLHQIRAVEFRPICGELGESKVPVRRSNSAPNSDTNGTRPKPAWPESLGTMTD